MHLGLLGYLLAANSIIAFVLLIVVLADLVALWHQRRLGVDKKDLQFISLVAVAAVAVSVIAFLLLYYMVSSDAGVIDWAALALSVALVSLLLAFYRAFKKYVSVYLDEHGHKIPTFAIHEDDVRKKPGARAARHFRRAKKIIRK